MAWGNARSYEFTKPKIENLSKRRSFVLNQKDTRTNTSKEDEKTARVVELLLLFLALLFLTSCSYLPVSQEMGNMSLLRSFSVDSGEEYRWDVTVSTGVQGNGLQGNTQPPTVLSGSGDSLLGACRLLEHQTSNTVFYGYVDQLILSQSVAEDGLLPVLEYFVSNPSLSLGTTVWLTEGTAGDILTATEEEGANAFLSTLVKESQLGTAGITRKVGDILTELREEQSSFIPVLAPIANEGLLEVGYGILKEDSFLALLQGDQATGLSLLKEQDQLLEVTNVEGTYALELSGISVSYKGIWEGSGSGRKLNSVQIFLDAQGDLMEYPTLPTVLEQENLIYQSQQEMAHLCENTLDILQELEADVLFMGSRLALKHPTRTRELITDWAEVFPTLDLSVEVRLTLSQVKGL